MRNCLALALALTLGLAPASQAQRTTSAEGAVHKARDAVAHLARAVRGNLPRGVGGPAGPPGPCPTRIGRICHWPEPEDAPPPPPDAPAVVSARKQAIALLDSAAAAQPANGWVAGQRVKLLVEAGDDSAAILAARACRSDAVWCAELAGYALHAGRRYAAADSAFSAAVRSMSADARCRWEDMSALLGGELARRYHDADCAAREALATRIWWLASPLFLVSNVDARTEYEARLTRARMADDDPEAELFGWDDDARQTALRYGWSVWYSQDPPAPGAIIEPAIVGHERGGSYYFFPDARALDSLGASDSTDWHLDEDRAPSAYAPAYARSVHALAVRTARFRRGDSLGVVAAWDARRDTTMSHGPLQAGLFIGTAPDAMRSARAVNASATGALALTVAQQPALASVELLDAVHERAARTRFGIEPLTDERVGLSDLLVLRAAPSDDPTLGELAELAGGAAAGVSTILYYELYTPSDSSALVSMDLRVEPRRSSWAHRLAERLHLAGAPSAVTLRWTDRARLTGRTPRALHLDLSGVAAGSYYVRVVARNARGDALASSTATLDTGDSP